MPIYCKKCGKEETLEEISCDNHVCKPVCPKCKGEGYIENYNDDKVNCPMCRGIKWDT